MNNAKWKTLALCLMSAVFFITVMGVLSFVTANGEAVIGPNPASVADQKADIALNTLLWAGLAGAVSLFSFVMSKRGPSADSRN